MSSPAPGFVWAVQPEIFSFSPVPRWYSVLFAGGIVGGYWLMRLFWKREDRPEQTLAALDSLLMYSVLGMTIGMRLAHCLFYSPGYYLSRPWEIPMIWLGGYASHGGFAGLAAALFIFSRRYPKIDFLRLADQVSVACMFTAGMIRIGNFFNSEMIGHPSDLPWSVTFSLIDQVPRHPAQVYEALGYFTVCAIGWFCAWRTLIRTTKGRLFGLMMILGFSWRLFCEFFKENQADFEQGMWLNMGQILSLPFIAVGIWLLCRRRQL